MIARIEVCDPRGHTLKGAKAALEGAGSVHAEREAGEAHGTSTPGDLLPRLKAIRAELAAALAA